MFGFVRGRAVAVVFVLAGVVVGSGAGPSTTVTWKVSFLTAGQVIKLSDVASSNSSGVKTWLKTGSCTLSPTSKPTTLTMGSTGSCTLTLTIAKLGTYPVKTSTKIITPKSTSTTTSVASTTTSVASTTTSVASTTTSVASTTTSVAPTTTSVAPTTTTVAPTTVPRTTVPRTTTTTTTVPPLVYRVGDTGPSGGIIFYKDLTRAAGSRYFEVACAGWSDGTCGGSDKDPKIEWGCYETLITGADGTLIGTGEQNTIDIVNGCPTDGIAAKVAKALVLGGQSDWFLPSKDELNALCKWAVGDTVNAVCNSSDPRYLTYGGFSNSGVYWSSTEGPNSGAAFAHWFPTDWQVYLVKEDPYSVRPVRSF